MRNYLKSFLNIPPEIRHEFWQDTLQKNQLSLLVICIMILGMELFNIARVLFWSRSGLATVNNRIYFSMYCILLLAAVLYILLQWLLRRSPVKIRWTVQYATALFALLWHVCINAYDLYRNPDGGTVIYVTAVLGLSVFIQMPSQYSLISYIAAYLLFIGLSASNLDTGSMINLTFTAIVALAVSLTRCRHAVVILSQCRKIDQMNRQLQELIKKDPLTGLLNITAFRDRVEFYLAETKEPTETALLILDLDDFKAVNDHFGHPCGDYVLQMTAIKFQAMFPEAIGVSRIGGDEFMMALSGVPAQVIEKAALQLIQDIALINWHGQNLGASCSLGVCRTNRPGVAYDSLYEIADQALYQAKTQGKGCCFFRELTDSV
ncbi:MAG TPA: GGDEF domain-containing protein [Candidatus Blautia avicola]|uniref:GGDEF domain-containing protein n=1 Tax=Candidatus Blautia avicola TaxID=2838483 RepID=A0A9D2QTW5_9FIRM|nr:GGDEF domain-containing protein [Candidatus Blautia avicola]